MSRWRVVTTAGFDKDVRRLDRSVARRVLDYLDMLGALDDPRARGKSLTGNLAGYWRYRIGDYRVLALITDSEMTIVAMDVAHRSEIYGR